MGEAHATGRFILNLYPLDEGSSENQKYGFQATSVFYIVPHYIFSSRSVGFAHE